MPPKKCSDKAPLAQKETSLSTCYRRGLSSGFVAGLNKAKMIQKKKMPAILAASQAI
jgi:hypothetical protein